MIGPGGCGSHVAGKVMFQAMVIAACSMPETPWLRHVEVYQFLQVQTIQT